MTAVSDFKTAHDAAGADYTASLVDFRAKYVALAAHKRLYEGVFGETNGFARDMPDSNQFIHPAFQSHPPWEGLEGDIQAALVALKASAGL